MHWFLIFWHQAEKFDTRWCWWQMWGMVQGTQKQPSLVLRCTALRLHACMVHAYMDGATKRIIANHLAAGVTFLWYTPMLQHRQLVCTNYNADATEPCNQLQPCRCKFERITRNKISWLIHLGKQKNIFGATALRPPPPLPLQSI